MSTTASSQLRRTKIVATIGPATDTFEKLEALILAGVNVVRVNFSHGAKEEHQQRVDNVRKIAEKHGVAVAILGDLQGPKIRIARFKEGAVNLTVGQSFTLDIEGDKNGGDENGVGVDFKTLPEFVGSGDQLLLDDGRLRLEVTGVEGSKVFTKVLIGGKLSNNKGINKLGGGLSAPALTPKDKEDIKTAAAFGMDYVAVSFPSHAGDIEEARSLLQAESSDAKIVAKVERAEAVNDLEVLDSIILASDAVMVARGDLGVEIGEAELVGVQKHMIQRSNELNRPVITATQMMESMIENSMPTRAEVFDVANAVLDGTDAVMLSAETAAGKYPAEVVKSMASICLGAESHGGQIAESKDMEHNSKVDNAVAKAAVHIANHLDDVKAIICLTESGNTALWASRMNSGLPILALSPHASTYNRVALFRGVYPMAFEPGNFEPGKVAVGALAQLKEQGFVNEGDLVVLTKGDIMSTKGSSNTIKILQV